jgi:hypothetical protein
MRRLGQGQNVMFLASNEVAALIVEATSCDPRCITSKEVLIWTIKETWRQLQVSLPAYVVQGHSFAKREAAWNSFQEGHTSHQQLAEVLCEQESRNLKELYGPDLGSEVSWIREYHSPTASNEISRTIYERCTTFQVFSISDAKIDEEKEVELVHEKEVERVIERPQPATAVQHYLRTPVKDFVDSGVFRLSSGVFHKIDSALLHTSIPIPLGLQDALPNLYVTEDFCRTVKVPSSSASSSNLKGAMDDFMRPVEWLVVPRDPLPAYGVIFSPFEVNELFNQIKYSGKVRLHAFAAHTTLSMRPFDTFDSFTLPSQTNSVLPLSLRHQINIFAGSIFIRDYQTYQDICKVLKLHFDTIETDTSTMSDLTVRDVVDSTFFVFDPSTRLQLGLDEGGFQTSPVPFLSKLLTIRRHGQGLGSSHMGKLLRGVKLKEEDFMDEVESN